MARAATLAAAGLGALAWAAQAQPQTKVQAEIQPPVLAQAAPVAPGKVDPHARMGKAYGDAVAALPDWNGTWAVAGGFVMDPLTARNAHDTNRGSDFGSPGGSYQTSAPYRPEWQAVYNKRVAESAAGRAGDYVADCRVEGMPRLLAGTPGPVEIVLLPKVVFMTWSYLGQTRRIYTDGRPHPPRDVAYPRDLGRSTARWEGDTLVVDTVDMREGIFDMTEAPHSDQLHLTERLHMRPDGQLQDDMTLADPVVFTRPWQVTRTLYRLQGPGIDRKTPGPDWADVETTFCDNNRNPLVNGVESVLLPGDMPDGKR